MNRTKLIGKLLDNRTLFGFSVLLVLSLWLVNLALPHSQFLQQLFGANSSSFQGLGEFGDMFGASNALFSGLAFIGLIFTIRQQSNEIKLQKEELEATRETLNSQKDQLESQAKTLRLQAFESTYFQLVALFKRFVENMKFGAPHHQLYAEGELCFARYASIFDQARKNSQLDPLESIFNAFPAAYQEAYGYFRIFKQIVYFVDDQEIDNKLFYIDTLRSSLSQRELVAIFYYGLFNSQNGDLKSKLEAYGFFQDLQRGDWFPAEADLSLYDEGAL